jgi:hypothetical protein
MALKADHLHRLCKLQETACWLFDVQKGSQSLACEVKVFFLAFWFEKRRTTFISMFTPFSKNGKGLTLMDDLFHDAFANILLIGAGLMVGEWSSCLPGNTSTGSNSHIFTWIWES